jgi:hypothetical protein
MKILELEDLVKKLSNSCDEKKSELEKVQGEFRDYKIGLEEEIVKDLLCDEYTILEKKKEREKILANFLNHQAKEVALEFMNDSKKGNKSNCTSNWDTYNRRGGKAFGTGTEKIYNLLLEKRNEWGQDYGPKLEVFIETFKMMRDKLREDSPWFYNNSIIKKTNSFEKEERLIIGKYLHQEKILEGCDIFGTFKIATSCRGCKESERNLEILNLKDLAEHIGQRTYKIPEQVFEDALGRLTKDKQSFKEFQEKENYLKKFIEKTQNEFIDQKKKLDALRYLKPEVADKTLELMPEFLTQLCNIDRSGGGINSMITYITTVPDKNVGVILTDKTYYSGTGGCEYGIFVSVFRDGRVGKKYFKYRDSHSEALDNQQLNFEKARIIDISKDAVRIELTGRYKNTLEETFEINEDKYFREISNVNINKFQDHYKKEKDRLVQEHYKDKTMPDYIFLQESGLEGHTLLGIGGGREIEYSKPSIIDEYFEPQLGVGIIILKNQIDHCAGHGIQFEWTAYKITNTETKLIANESAYSKALKQGKRIDMKAEELYHTFTN